MKKMTEQQRKEKRDLRKKLQLDFVLPEDIPDLELYMDQVTNFMDQNLKNNLRSADDKTLTRTMINNYTRNKLMPPPQKKKYSRDHLILLIYIYYLKNVVSMSDIRKILAPFADGTSHEDLYEIYRTTFEMEKNEYFNIENSTYRALQIVEKEYTSEEEEHLKKMQFIFLLGYDIFCKKRLIEKILDEMPDPDAPDNSEEGQGTGKGQGKDRERTGKGIIHDQRE